MPLHNILIQQVICFGEIFVFFFYLPEKIIRAKEWCEGKTVQRPFEAGL